MHDEDIRRRVLTTAQEDEIIQRSVLTEVLVLHPAQLTILELALRVEADQRGCEQDAVERAVRELARDGLAHQSGTEPAPRATRRPSRQASDAPPATSPLQPDTLCPSDVVPGPQFGDPKRQEGSASWR